MEFLQLHAEDVDGDLEMGIPVEEKTVQDQEFIDDSVSFSNKPSFYRGVNNNCETSAVDDYSEWLIDEDSQLENYMLCGLINPE